MPGSVTCNIHSWVKGYVLLRANPYMAKTDLDGRFTIKHLPAGKHTFMLWHERVGYLRDLTIGPTESDSKGQIQVQIGDATTDLGDVKLGPELFQKGK